jgi:ribosomal protein L37AE/L43A
MGCWYEAQGFLRCEKLDGCVEKATTKRADRLWVCPECHQERYGPAQTDVLYCIHAGDHVVTMILKDAT